MKVNSNIQGMISQAILHSNEEKMAKSTQKMSSGYKINYAKDNPAGMAISNRMKAQLRSLDRANKNAKNAINAVQTAEGAMNEIEAMLQRMNEISVQASNGTMTDQDRQAIDEEVKQLCNEITRISKDTTFNTQGLLDGSQELKGYSKEPSKLTVRSYNEFFDNGKYQISLNADGTVTGDKIKMLNDDGTTKDVAVTYEVTEYEKEDAGGTTKKSYSTRIFTADGGELVIDKNNEDAQTDVEIEAKGIGGMKVQTGAEEGQEIQVVIPKMSLKNLGLADLDNELVIDCSTEAGAKKALDLVSKAIDYVSSARSKLGAYQNRIEKTVSNLDSSTENLTESYSTIKDLDMAEGMVEYTTLQVLIQAGTTMLAQANEQPQQALQLLQ